MLEIFISLALIGGFGLMSESDTFRWVRQVYTGTSYAIDGCATFFRRDRFSLVKKYEVLVFFQLIIVFVVRVVRVEDCMSR